MKGIFRKKREKVAQKSDNDQDSPRDGLQEEEDQPLQ